MRDGRCLSFSVSGGRNSDGTLRGKGLMLTDPARGLTLKSQAVTGYRFVDANIRIIIGTATVNGRAGFTCRVTINDNGRGSRDTIRIEVFNPQGQRILFCEERLECGNLRIIMLRPVPIPTPRLGAPPCNCGN